MANLCNLNGVIAPEEKTSIPVLDRGFLFGDSIYEVVETIGGVPFALPEHLERLRGSADGLQMKLDVSDETLLRRLAETLQQAKHPESYVRFVITRGVGSAPNIDAAYAKGPCNVLIFVRALPDLSGSEGNLAIIQRLRNDRRALDPACKTGNYLNNVLGLMEAKAAGAADALFRNTAGYLTEASTSNIWIVRDGVLLTPPLSAGILAGVTRRLLLDMCAEEKIPCAEKDITKAEICSAPEVFTTSTLKHVLPITKLDGKPVGDGRPGKITTGIKTRFAAWCRRRHETVYVPAWAEYRANQA